MAPDPVTATVHVDVPPERVWEYLTQPEAIVRWMGEYALLDPRPGGRFAVNVKGTPVRGRFLCLDPPRRLLISWGYAGSDRLPPGASTVEVRLTPDGTGTRVDLEHHDLPLLLAGTYRPAPARDRVTRLSAATVGECGPDPGMCGTPLSPANMAPRRAYRVGLPWLTRVSPLEPVLHERQVAKEHVHHLAVGDRREAQQDRGQVREKDQAEGGRGAQ